LLSLQVLGQPKTKTKSKMKDKMKGQMGEDIR